MLLFNDEPPFKVERGLHPNRTEKHPWGAWRRPHDTSRHKTSCFDITIITNELGARDDSFSNGSTESIVLLGDSFAEGYGVSHANSAATILEEKIGRPIHNLGSAGNFGPLQQYLIYREFVGIIKHSEVLIFLLPANDFTDNDYSSWSESKAQRKRYRPYFGAKEPLIPFYPNEAVPTDNQINPGETQTLAAYVKDFLVAYTWTANSLRTIKYLYDPPEPIIDVTQPSSNYTAATLQQQKNLITAYAAIIRDAHPRPVSVIIIPGDDDINYYRASGHSMDYKSMLWFKELKKLAEKTGGTLIDLLEHTPDDHAQLFHSCDGHWSAKGNLWAAQTLYEQLLNLPKSPTERK